MKRKSRGAPVRKVMREEDKKNRLGRKKSPG